MSLRTVLRSLRVLGCEATRDRVTLHLREDTSLDPAKVMAKVAEARSAYRLSPDMKLTRRFGEGDGTALDRVETVLREIEALKKV
jgi:transcription-repair coupling factor (superfamily II helicase)